MVDHSEKGESKQLEELCGGWTGSVVVKSSFFAFFAARLLPSAMRSKISPWN
jgi:hypothetical protein